MSDTKTAKVKKFEASAGTWHLVEYGGWQISVAPDGLLMLPRHLHPTEVEEFCAAALAAAEVGSKTLAENAAKTTPQPTAEELAQTTGVIVKEGPPPPGAVKMQITARAAKARDAGRPRVRDPRSPRAQQQPPTIQGVRNGRKQT
jgi:hypothetical protein